MFKELKGSMKMMLHRQENMNKKIKKRIKQILEWKSMITEIKNSLKQ